MAAAPTTIGRYRVLAKIGQGGMGAVFKAVDPASGAVVAIKVVAADHAQDPRFLERLRREAVAAAAVRHPNVTAFLEGGVEAGQPFLVYEHVAGGSLEDRLKLGPLPWREAVALGAQVGHALAAIHAVGIFHRDLKPANVLLDEQGRAKVTDLGLARVRLLGAASLTRTGELVGTLAYMAPEQARGGKEVDARADLYALGATLYALLTGRPPFEGTSNEVATKLLMEMPAPPRAVVPAIPAGVERVVLRLLAKDPAARAIDAASVASELEALLAAPEPAPPQSRVPLVAGAVVLLGAVALAVAFLTRRPEVRTPDLPAAPAPGPAAPTAPKKNPTAPPSPAANAPAWYRDLGEGERPTLPLLPGLRFGDAKREYVNETDGSVLVYVPGGTFEMGADGTSDDEGPAHQVKLSPYFIGRYEVTNEKLAEFLKRTKHTIATEGGVSGLDLIFFEGGVKYLAGLAGRTLTWTDRYLVAPEEPRPTEAVVQVSLADARAYCDWAGLVLPTEAQWERAASWDARRKKKLRFPWGDEPEPGSGGEPLANFADESLRHLPGYAPFPIVEGFRDGFPRVAPVGSFPRDVSPMGALDMAGNVQELCLDVFNAKFYGTKDASKANPVCTEPDGPVLAASRRGYSWASSYAFRMTRRGRAAQIAHSDTGFRVARAAR